MLRLLKIDKTSYKNIDIYYIGYIAIKKIDDYESIYTVNPLYLHISHASRYIEETTSSRECELCHYWLFRDVGFKFEEHVCNRCHDLMTMAYSLGNIAILSAKGATFRCILWGISRNEGLKRF